MIRGARRAAALVLVPAMLGMASMSAATYRSHGALLTYAAYGRGPVVVVMAGGPGLNAAYMDPLAFTIAADGYRAIVPDQRGTGGATAAAGDHAMLGQAGTVADLEALRRRLGVARLNFVTHSFGGAMALAYAAAHPARVGNLVLIGSVGTDLGGVDRFGHILMTRLSAGERERYAAAGARGDDATALNLQLLAEFDDRAKAREVIATEPHPFIYPAVSNAVANDFAKNYHVGNALRAVRAPVTLLTGSDDAALVMEPSLIRAFPGAHVVHIAHSGHWPWVENAAQFDPALRAALARGARYRESMQARKT